MQNGAKERDLRRETYDLLSGHSFREPTAEEKRILGLTGHDIFLSTEAKTLYAVVAENESYFLSGTLGWVNTISNLKNFAPPTLTVALRSRALFLANSFGKSQAIQLQLHEEESQAWQELLPDARNIMLPVSVDAQLDLLYFKETGQVLFANRFIRALDKTSAVEIAHIGRDDPDHQLIVHEWVRGDGYSFIGALSAVVMINS